MSERTYDILAIGRSSIDLYSNDIGTPFPEIGSFGAFVGGCPTNISVGTRRLGLRSAVLTALGEDPVGDFILKFLNDEDVETKFVCHKPGHRTSAVVLGIEPPDRFPLVYYRDNCADIELTIDDVLAAPIADSSALLISGTGLSKEPSRSANLFAAEYAQSVGTTVFFDLDFRADQWHDPRAFGVVARSALPLIDIALGTEEEVKAASLSDASQLSITHSQISNPDIEGDVNAAIETILDGGPEALVMKRGIEGADVHLSDGASYQRRSISRRGVQHTRCGRCLRQRFRLWPPERLGLGTVCPSRQCDRRNCRHSARLRELYADNARSRGFC